MRTYCIARCALILAYRVSHKQLHFITILQHYLQLIFMHFIQKQSQCPSQEPGAELAAMPALFSFFFKFLGCNPPEKSLSPTLLLFSE